MEISKKQRYSITIAQIQETTHNTANVPLTPHRHAGLDPVSSKSLKPLDSGLHRNGNTIGFPASQTLRQRQQNKIRLTNGTAVNT
ncbi:MAG: hypothetical protein GXP23_00840 [Gammaproteobacteria bacterium]|nr:hypothetical protein [Gammaproteobacteria bacterium]